MKCSADCCNCKHGALQFEIKGSFSCAHSAQVTTTAHGPSRPLINGPTALVGEEVDLSSQIVT